MMGNIPSLIENELYFLTDVTLSKPQNKFLDDFCTRLICFQNEKKKINSFNRETIFLS